MNYLNRISILWHEFKTKSYARDIDELGHMLNEWFSKSSLVSDFSAVEQFYYLVRVFFSDYRRLHRLPVFSEKDIDVALDFSEALMGKCSLEEILFNDFHSRMIDLYNKEFQIVLKNLETQKDEIDTSEVDALIRKLQQDENKEDVTSIDNPGCNKRSIYLYSEIDGADDLLKKTITPFIEGGIVFKVCNSIEDLYESINSSSLASGYFILTGSRINSSIYNRITESENKKFRLIWMIREFSSVNNISDDDRIIFMKFPPIIDKLVEQIS